MTETYDGYLIHLAEQQLEKEKEGLKPDRGPIDAVWLAIADNKLPDADTAEWARIIARRVKDTVLLDTSFPDERPRRALRALGLFSTVDANYDERRALGLFLEFLDFAIRPDERQSLQTQMLGYMRGIGFYEGLSDKAAKARISRLQVQLRKVPRGG
jgi:hypothetical protein